MARPLNPGWLIQEHKAISTSCIRIKTAVSSVYLVELDAQLGCEILFWYSIAKTDFVEAIPAEYCSHYGDFVYNTSSCVAHSTVQRQESQIHWATNKYSLCSTHFLKTE